MGIEPGPQDLEANTLPRCCKSRLLPQGSRSVLYTYPYYIFPCFKLIRPWISSEPHCFSGTFHPDARNPSWDPHTGHQMSQGAEKSQLPEVGIEPGPPDLKANTLPRRCKSRLLPQGSRCELYTYTYYIFPCFKLIRPKISSELRCYSGAFHLDARNTSRRPTLSHQMSQGAEKSQPPKWESNLGRRI